MSGQVTLQLGAHQAAFQQAAQRAQDERVIERIWERDYTLWAPQPDEISNRLGWLDIAERMQAEVPALQAFATEARAAGLKRVLLLGMGGSSLAPELFSRLFAEDSWGKEEQPEERQTRLRVLDSTDPAAVLAADEAHPPRETLYIVSSKSGGTVETLSFFQYFYNRALDVLGVDLVGAHFIAITDPGSSLAALAERYKFRKCFLADANIGGRYSALSHFGLVPAALIGADLEAILASAQDMAARCRNEDLEQNPGAQLGIAIASLALAGRDKLTFKMELDLDGRDGEIYMLGPEYWPLIKRTGSADWAEQLIAESTGKAGRGIIPVVHEPGRLSYRTDRVFVEYPGGRGFTQREEHPILQIDWDEDNEVGAQFFLWEFATAVAGHILGINPFDQPDVELAKVQARQFVQHYQKNGKLPNSDLLQVSNFALRNFIELAKAGDYIVIQAYFHDDYKISSTLNDLRWQLGEETQLATTLGYGPRYLHSTGQLHKGDAGQGLFIQLIGDSAPDVPIPIEAGEPESDLTFGALKMAQALGDAQALRAAGRRVLSFHITGEIEPALKGLLFDEY